MPILDGIRGFAALWVVLYHAQTAGHIDAFSQALPKPITAILFDWGYLGVPIFFVLSGFVIAHSLFDKQPSLGQFKTFMVRRFLRLAPAYWMSLLLTLALGWAASMAQSEAWTWPSLFSMAAHLGFVQDVFHQTPISPVYWTLGVEMQFYALFYGLLLLNQQLQQSKSQYRAIFVAASTLALVGLGTTPQLMAWGKFFLPYWFCFWLGVVTHWTVNRRLALGWLLGTIAAALALATAQFNIWPETLTYSITGSALALALVAWAKLDKLHQEIDPITSRLGTLSYSVYLIHSMIFGPLFFLSKRLLPEAAWADLFGLVGALAVTYAMAELMWRWVEKPSMDWSRRLRKRSSTSGAMPTA